jgi:hypothetical protein
LHDIDSLITTVRGCKVILDSDLAALYQVSTKALNQAVKRNREKFPPDFLLSITASEAEELRRLRSQFVTLKAGRGQQFGKDSPAHGTANAATAIPAEIDGFQLLRGATTLKVPSFDRRKTFLNK